MNTNGFKARQMALKLSHNNCVGALMTLVLFFVQLTTTIAAKPITYIDVGGIFGGPKLSFSREFAVQTCAGLYNRNMAKNGAVYTFHSIRDVEWLVSTHNNDTIVNKTALTDPLDFIQACLQTTQGYLRYSFSVQKIIIPNLVTLAAVLDAVPLEDSDIELLLNTTTSTILKKFDALEQFPPSLTADHTNAPRHVTQWMLDTFGNQTTGGIAKMNPGLDVHSRRKVFPPLNQDPNLGLVDYIVSQKLFNFFLYFGCIPLTDDHQLMERIASFPEWKHPLRVMGYDDTIAAGGDIFEAETDCVKEHDMGQVASDGCSNLSFYSSMGKSIDKPLLQVPDPPTIHEAYSPNITYLTVVMGDGDNLNFVKDSRREWMQQRVAACGTTQTKGTCFPLVWSLSPAALYLMPDVMKWYYQQSYMTRTDWFVLPPSGHLYSYPGEMQTADQAAFVAATEHDAWLMNTSATVSWEFTSTWNKAIANYFPRYAAGKDQVIQSCFAVNVPYFVPIRAFGRNEHYKIINANNNNNNTVVLFAPREWRGKDSPNIPFVKPTGLSPADMAAEISSYPKGTVSHIYATSDGGFDFQQLTEMVDALEHHVRLVGSNELALRAKQREEYVTRVFGEERSNVGMEEAMT